MYFGCTNLTKKILRICLGSGEKTFAIHAILLCPSFTVLLVFRLHTLHSLSNKLPTQFKPYGNILIKLEDVKNPY